MNVVHAPREHRDSMLNGPSKKAACGCPVRSYTRESWLLLHGSDVPYFSSRLSAPGFKLQQTAALELLV